MELFVSNSLVKSDPVLPALDKARAALAVAYANRDASAAKDVIDQAAAVKVYSARRDGGLELARQAGEIQVRAEWTLGRILIAMKESGERDAGGKGPRIECPAGTQLPKLSDLGISKKLSSKAQTMAGLSEGDLDEQIQEAVKAEKPPTSTAVVREAKKRQRKKKKADKKQTLSKANIDAPPEERRYSVIYADPPWQYECNLDNDRAVDNHYPTMEHGGILSLKVGGRTVSEVAHDDAILFMWTTSPKVSEACEVIKEWGFRYVGCAIWDKQNIGIGNYFRIQHEILMYATRGKIGTPEVPDRPTWSVYSEKRGKHSVKPSAFYGVIENMYRDCTRIELFSRGKRDGWDAWGYEVDG